MEYSFFGMVYRGWMGVTVAAVVVTLTGLLLSWISRLTFRRRGRALRLPPGPKGWPLIGALPYLGQFPHLSLHKLSKKYGSLMYMHLGSMNVLVISDSEMAKEVLQRNDQLFASRPQLVLPGLLLPSLSGPNDIAWSPYGVYWRQIRKITNFHLLTSSKLSHSMDILQGEVLSTVHTVLEQAKSCGKGGLDVGAVFNGMTMNIITLMMWNRRHRNTTGSLSQSDKKFEDLIKKVMALLGSNNVADFLPSFLKSFAVKMSGLDKIAADTHRELDDFCESIINEREQVSSKDSKTITDEDDFVNVMLKLQNEALSEEYPGLSRDAMKAILRDMITAGTDTTALTLDWILSELLIHPEMMKKAQAELTSVVGESRLVKESDIPNLKYIDAIIKEAFRKHSAGPMGLPHLSMADCKVGGYDVPANTTVFVNIFAIHHNPAVWEKPDAFNPDRFLESDLDYKGRNFDFIPFSSGRRICPGMNFASTVLHVGLAQLLHCVNWSLPEGQTPEDVDMTPSPGLTLMKAIPLLVNAKPRLPHHVLSPAIAPAA